MEQENLLVKQAQQGDVHAFAQLYECCYRDLYRFALYNLGQEEDARDVVSDTVLAAFEGIGRLRSAEAWLDFSDFAESVPETATAIYA